MPLYQYIPIVGDRSIRVIHLFPSSQYDAPLRCEIKTLALEDYPNWSAPYTALSYTWDGQPSDRPIECDGGQLMVTANAEAAMRSLRDASDEKILWIDGICINQDPEAVLERNHQVAMMGDIYKNAGRVTIWLGDENASILRAFEAMKKVVPWTETGEPAFARGQDRRHVQNEIRRVVQEISNGVDAGQEEPFSPLFTTSWFYRCWTLQEATIPVNPGRVVFRCGSHEAPYLALFLTIDGMKQVRYRHCPWREAMSSQNQFSTYLLYARFPQGRASMDDNAGDIHNKPLVFSILIKARSKHATKPEDKIFALYGLLAEVEVGFPSPDYTKPLATIYREATVAAINHDKLLYILYHAPSDQRRDGLPSWVPDWSTEGWSENDPRYGLLRARFAASARSLPLFRFTDDDSKLVVRGRVIDTIILRGQGLPQSDELKSRFANHSLGPWTLDQDGTLSTHHREVYPIVQEWMDLAHTSEYPTGESSKDAFKFTLTYDFPQFNQMADKSDGFNTWYDILARESADSAAQLLIPSFQSPPADPPNLQAALGRLFDLPRRIGNALQLKPHAAEFYTNFLMRFGKKCFLLTERGYFGTAPDPLPTPVEAGDVVALVSGLEMPLILRPAEGGYRLLTHAFIHGVMYGSQWPEREDALDDIILV